MKNSNDEEKKSKSAFSPSPYRLLWVQFHPVPLKNKNAESPSPPLYNFSSLISKEIWMITENSEILLNLTGKSPSPLTRCQCMVLLTTFL